MLYHKRFPVLVLFLAFLVLFAAVLPAYASTLDQKRQEQQQLEKQLQQERANLQQQRNREVALKQEMDQLDRRLRALRSELERLGGEIRRTEGEIVVAETELAEAEEQLSIQEALFNKRLRAIYEQGSVTYLEVLLSASNFSDFLTRLNNLKIIASNDLRLLEEIQAERDRVQARKDELEQKKNSLEGMRRQVINNEADLERTVASRERILVELQAEIARNAKAIRDLEKEAEALDRIIQDLIRQSQGFNGVQGKMHYPIEAPTWISSGYGWRKDPFTGASVWHGGVDIAPYYGNANYILAAADGRVIFSGAQTTGGSVNFAPGNDAGRSNLTGYGSYIMIDHGNGTVTLYAHMSSRSVSVGQNVARGQRIGRAGTTGYSTGVHLHFEVREYNKKPVRYYPSGAPDYRHNPMSYF